VSGIERIGNIDRNGQKIFELHRAPFDDVSLRCGAHHSDEDAPVQSTSRTMKADS
jgi:hypothetical protein